MADWRTRIERRREELGYTRAELARRADLKPTMIHDIVERGVTPSVANLFKIARALNFTLSSFKIQSSLFPQAQQDREDVEIAWAAPISMIVRD